MRVKSLGRISLTGASQSIMLATVATAILGISQSAGAATLGWAQTGRASTEMLTGALSGQWMGAHLSAPGEVSTPMDGGASAATDSGAPTAATPVDAQRWNSWIAYVLQTAAPVEKSSGYFCTMTSMVPNDPTKTHIANYFSVVGWYDQQNKFAPSFISAVSENWKISANGTRDIDQWIFDVDLAGVISHAEHMHLVETIDNEVLVDDFLPTTPDLIAAEWAKRMDAWYASQPAVPAPIPAPPVSSLDLR